MDINIIKDKIKELRHNTNSDLTDEIFRILNGIDGNNYSDDEIIELKRLYKETGDIILAVGLGSKLNNYSEFENKFVSGKSIKTIPTIEPDKDDFERVLTKFIENEINLLKHIKGFFLVKIETGTPSQTDILFLYDENLKSSPHLTKLKQDFPDIGVEDTTIELFSKASKNDKRFLVLLYISENITESIRTTGKIKNIIDKYSSFVYYQLDEKGISKLYTDPSKLLEDIEYYSTKIFNNKEFTQEEEILIKKFFSDDCSILNYKTLKNGFSGAKVIEVQAQKSFNESSRRVIKIDKRASEKITIEYKAFEKCISEYNIQGYNCKYQKTTNLEAISYNYASTDGFIDSHSFNDIINDNILKINKLKVDVASAIEKLLICEPFKTWKQPGKILNESKKVNDLYKNYIDNDKSTNQLINILNNERKSKTIIENINELLSRKINIKEKFCHGDLHTQNIFQDEKNEVSLIDFGWTERRHAIIDHAFLESSLKYNHIPRHITTDELIIIESKFNVPESFNNTLSLTFIEREELKSIYCWILKIRSDAINYFYDQTDFNEYYIALIIIAYRMILFNDLNQQFAYKSLEQLLKLIDE